MISLICEIWFFKKTQINLLTKQKQTYRHWKQIYDSVQFSGSVVSDSLRPHEPQHTRPPCPSPTPRVHSYSCPLSQWCHPAISSSVVPFSSCPQSLPASDSFPMSQLFAWGGQSTEVSAFTKRKVLGEVINQVFGINILTILYMREEEIAIHSSILAWKIPQTEKPGRLQSMRSQRVGHCLATDQQQQQ